MRTADGEAVQAMLYVWPSSRADEVDLAQQWSYAHFRAVSLELFVRDVVVPCAAEFAEEEAQAAQELRRRQILAAVAVASAAAGIAWWRSR